MKSKTFLLKEKGDWALVSVSFDPGVTVMINSSLGAWCFTWGQPGEDPVRFLEEADVWYTYGKFSNTMKLGLPKRWQKQELESHYKFFYEKFWKKIIEELKK